MRRSQVRAGHDFGHENIMILMILGKERSRGVASWSDDRTTWVSYPRLYLTSPKKNIKEKK
jgi:hypothetical protein